jgi:hypothetical protein
MVIAATTEQLLEQHLRFWQMAPAQRPLLSCSLGSYFPLQDFPGLLPEGLVEPEDVRPERFLPVYEALYSDRARVGDSLFYAASAFTGIPWVEAILGCSIYASTETMWSEPFLEDWRRMDGFHLRDDNPWLAKLVEFVRVLGEASGGRFPLTTTLMRGPSDLVAALRGAGQLCYDVYDYPDEVDQLARLCTEVWIEVAKAQRDAMPRFQGGYVNSQGVWAPAFTPMTQEDASVFLSPALNRRFLLPRDQETAEAFDYTAIHLHSKSLHTVDDLLTLDAMAAIQVVVDDGGPSVTSLMPTFQRIQKRKPLMLFGHLTREDYQELAEGLSAHGLLVMGFANSPEEAQELCDWAGELWACRSS